MVPILVVTEDGTTTNVGIPLSLNPNGEDHAQQNFRKKKVNMRRLAHSFLSQTRLVLGRSFFPLFAIAIIAGATLWGPWVSLTVTVLAVMAALRLL
jgi:hypothetical protein